MVKLDLELSKALYEKLTDMRATVEFSIHLLRELVPQTTRSMGPLLTNGETFKDEVIKMTKQMLRDAYQADYSRFHAECEKQGQDPGKMFQENLVEMKKLDPKAVEIINQVL